MRKTCYPWFPLHFFLVLWKKAPPTKFYSVLTMFMKFSTIQLYLDLTNIIHANENTKYATCTLHVNFWNFSSIPFCFTMKKDHFRQTLLLWFQVPFKDENLLAGEKLFSVIKFFERNIIYCNLIN